MLCNTNKHKINITILFPKELIFNSNSGIAVCFYFLVPHIKDLTIEVNLSLDMHKAFTHLNKYLNNTRTDIQGTHIAVVFSILIKFRCKTYPFYSDVCVTRTVLTFNVILI